MLRELSKESVLLLYLADELSAEDRTAVDAMLAGDAELRAALQELGGVVRSFDDRMALLDARPLPGEAAVPRRIGLALRQRLAEQAVQAPAAAVPASRGGHYPWWAYSSAAAAALMVVLLGWWGRQPSNNMYQPSARTDMYMPSPIAPTGPVAPVSPGLPTDDVRQLADGIFTPGAGGLTGSDKATASLEAAEEQVVELARSSSDRSGAFFGFSDGNE